VQECGELFALRARASFIPGVDCVLGVLLPAARVAADLLPRCVSLQCQTITSHELKAHHARVRASALLVLSTVTATRLLRVPFIEQLRLVCGSLLLFVVLVGLSSLPARAYLCVWLGVGALAPLIGIRANERIRRRAFAENLATRYAGGAGGRQLQEPPVHS
jgi:hypothetical protein